MRTRFNLCSLHRTSGNAQGTTLLNRTQETHVATHFHGVGGVVSPQPRCTVCGRDTDHARPISVSCEVRDRCGRKRCPAAAASAAVGRPELQQACRQGQVRGLLPEMVCRYRHKIRSAITTRRSESMVSEKTLIGVVSDLPGSWTLRTTGSPHWWLIPKQGIGTVLSTATSCSRPSSATLRDSGKNCKLKRKMRRVGHSW